MAQTPDIGPEGEPPSGAAAGSVLPAQLAEIEAALRAGNKIEAIKLYRLAAGVGLKEAKDAVEAMNVPGAPKSKSGCAAVLLVVLSLAASSALAAAAGLFGE